MRLSVVHGQNHRRQRTSCMRLDDAEFQDVERGVDGHPEGHGREDPPDELRKDFTAELPEQAGERTAPRRNDSQQEHNKAAAEEEEEQEEEGL